MGECSPALESSYRRLLLWNGNRGISGASVLTHVWKTRASVGATCLHWPFVGVHLAVRSDSPSCTGIILRVLDRGNSPQRVGDSEDCLVELPNTPVVLPEPSREVCTACKGRWCESLCLPSPRSVVYPRRNEGCPCAFEPCLTAVVRRATPA